MRRRTARPGCGAAVLAVAALLAVGGLAAAADGAAARGRPVYLDRSYSAAERAVDLVARMTPAERAAQLVTSQAPALPRLGIPAYGWWNEAAHGVAREQRSGGANPETLVETTSYPVSLSLASTWHPGLVHEEASAIGDEAREVVRDHRLDLTFFAPTVNLARDPRWGRNDETFGEDPFLTAVLAAQFVNGMEGKDRSGQLAPDADGYLRTATTLKHYAANNSEVDRLTGSSDMDERTLREYYTAHFRDVVRASGPAALMTAYNRVNGVPATANVHLLDRLARRTFGFRGLVVSDCDAVHTISARHAWRPPGREHPLDEVEAHAHANSAGVDLQCDEGWSGDLDNARALPAALARGIVTTTGPYEQSSVDASAVRLFTARMQLGELDGDAVPWVRRARRSLAAAEQRSGRTGPGVTQTPERLDLARRVARESVVLLQNEPPGRTSGGRPLLPLDIPASGPYRVAVVGDYARQSDPYLGGYSSEAGPGGRRNSVDAFTGLRAAVLARNPNAQVDHLPGLGGDLAAVDASSVAAVAGYDAVVVCVGTDGRHAAEDLDRTSLALPGAQAQLVRAVAARTPRTVLALETVGPVELEQLLPHVAAVVWRSYGGQRTGEALADVLTGGTGPSGRLPFTWHRSADDLPPLVDYGIRSSAAGPGRTYQYFRGPVTFPFGHGLTYQPVTYSDLRVDRGRVDADGSVRVSVRLENRGRRPVDEVAQLYVATPEAPASAQRPVKRLRAFQRVPLPSGAVREVTFSIRVPELAFFDADSGRFRVDAGRYVVEVGRSSADPDALRGQLLVTGRSDPVPVVLTAWPRSAGSSGGDVGHDVLFAPGVVVDPRLTLTLSDDSLRGHVPGGSRPLPEGTRLRLRSNRPAVVDVDADGVVRTRGGGVATVTAEATLDGRHVRTAFVLHVAGGPRPVSGLVAPGWWLGGATLVGVLASGWVLVRRRAARP